ncbi:DNA-directed RNA polymerase, mitochondrial isoform X2 [Cricetulus griseus]|uniref:DNA-directed RNA polymerase n=1 Tax=Cricetulus griseus TaxID=10029 RepID=A0A8C2MRX1_CRIGR|nr:DNA-directed RNA polymerase, mitochondrial isoform X2 [Cricetulus griseus]XP_027275256.1 DNA-directed RNA polymerase, mitochondrial isoform X2 [Cricetulus griseus]
MSALRWTRGAAGLGRALSSSGRRRPTSEEGTLSSLCSSRRSSAASPREQDVQKEWGHAELLEVLEARVRQLRAESMSEATVKKVQMDQPPNGHSSRWAQKLEAERQVKGKRQKELLDQHQKHTLTLQMEPWIWSKKLAGCLQQSKKGAPKSLEEEEQLLTQALKAALQKLSSCTLAKSNATAVEANILLLQQKFLAFFECCACTDNVPLAHHVLVTQHSKCDKQQLLTLDMYNTVMLSWARKGSFKELVYVFIMLKDAGLSPNLWSYAAALQCMGRRDQDVHIIQRCLKQMMEEGFQPQQLFTDLVLTGEERDALLRAVVKAEPAFILPPQAPEPVNTSILLQEVYAKKGPKSYPKLHLPLETLQDLFHQQLHVELSANVCVQSVEKAPVMTKEVIEARKTLKTLQGQWEAELLRVLQQTKATMAHQAQEGQPTLYPFLCLLSEGEFVSMLMQVLRLLPAQGEPLLHLAHDLGLRVLNRHLVKQKQATNHVQKLGQHYSQYLRLLASDTQVEAPCLPREYWESLGPLETPMQQPWSLTVLLHLGKQLAEMLVQAVQMPRNLSTPQASRHLIPVLYHVYSFRSYRQIGILKPHPAFSKLLETAAEPTLILETTEVPMLCPPLPWTTPHTGAYLLSSTKLMRATEGTTQHQHLLERCAPAQLHGALDALTQLGNCAWRVNGRLLDLVLQIFRDKGCTRLGVPPPRSEAPQPAQLRLPPGATPLHKAELRKELSRCLKIAREMHSLRIEALYRLSLAQHLRNRVFWLPHNMDFRGRTYPCPPYFNHLGSDLARALLEFAEGRPLGPRGLDWIKIHLVNLTGLRKRDSLRMRLRFADEVMEEILDSADNPMTGRKWWMEADEPWQTLACCIEVARAVRSPDAAAYVSHLPVHQDGSCNGLQHYAALGRDSAGAASVNLMPSDLPQDVYREVAAQVEELRQRDAKDGLQVAHVLKGFITRKVVKQTVMTVVYGVTRYGGRLQIEKRLRELSNFPQEFVWEASHYLVRLVFKSLQEMFSSTRAIQHWLTESANLISHSGWPVEWVTPLGIPVIQPYHREAKVQVKGGIQSITMTSSMDITQKPNTLKQKNGFPPNFIHSLDSAHMMLTALHCYRKGLTFVSVHDCFWTHAADIPVMNEVCREQFVRLHSQPILEDLAKFLEKRFCSVSSSQKPSELALATKLQKTLQSLPKTGTFDLSQVMKSTYFFS